MENKKIYAFDFDGTIVTNEFPKIGQPIQEVIDMIHEVKKQGHYIILYTMREDERLREALDFCRSYRIFFDAVNDNLRHMKHFYRNNPRKIFANYYIDDHNMGVRAINEDYAELKRRIGTDDTIDVMVYQCMMIQENKIKSLEQQLKAKDKALDRACEAVSRGSEGRYVEPKEELKELFEHGTD